MAPLLQELDHRVTPMGELTLRRRRLLAEGPDIYEVKLGEAFLMSSLFTAGERALATIGLAATANRDLDVVVGGLGLGYTAAQALEDPRVASLVVVDALEPVIDWHRKALVPLGPRLTGDPRCTLRLDDFFTFIEAGDGATFDAILLDIDHSPRAVLHESHERFYTAEGQRRLARRLRPGGAFAMWSNDPPDDAFLPALAGAFPKSRAEMVEFESSVHGKPASCTIYVAQDAA